MIEMGAAVWEIYLISLSLVHRSCLWSVSALELKLGSDANL